MSIVYVFIVHVMAGLPFSMTQIKLNSTTFCYVCRRFCCTEEFRDIIVYGHKFHFAKFRVKTVLTRNMARLQLHIYVTKVFCVGPYERGALKRCELR